MSFSVFGKATAKGNSRYTEASVAYKVLERLSHWSVPSSWVANFSKKGSRLGWSEGMIKISFMKEIFTYKFQKYAPLDAKLFP
jgi:hypothetical protein